MTNNLHGIGREILFRGQRVDNGEWVEGHYAEVNDYAGENGFTCSSNIPTIFDNEGEAYEVKPETVGQLTGFYDKDKKRIFEGDIIKVLSNRMGSSVRIIVIKYEKHSIGDFTNTSILGFRDYSESTYGASVEVIGNIHQDSHLLTNE